MTYQELRSYSPYHDADMLRISMTDARGQEFYMLIPAFAGKATRAAREAALEHIDEAIRLGLNPGEVRTT